MKFLKISIISLLISFNLNSQIIEGDNNSIITIFSADPFYELENSKYNNSLPSTNNIDEYQQLNIPIASIAELAKHDKYNIILPDGTHYNIIPKNKKMYSNNFLSISGYFEKFGEPSNYYSIFTFTTEGIVGDFYLPEGHFKADIKDEINVLYNPKYFDDFQSVNLFENDQGYTNDLQDILKKMESNSEDSPVTEKTSKGSTLDTILNIGIIISNSVGSFNTVKATAMNRIIFANQQYSDSNVNIQLELRFITSVKTEFDYNLSFNLTNTVNLFSTQQDNLIDFQSSNLEAFPSTLSQINIHQFVLIVGAQVNGTCGQTSTNAGGFGKFSVVRNPGTNTCSSSMVHEIGHNLTLVHNDGACKTTIQGDPICQYIGPPANTAKGLPSGTVTWRSVMRSQGNLSKYFTGGADDTIHDDSYCEGLGGYCNSSPFEDHNSIGKLNNARTIAANNYLPITFPTTANQPDQYDDIAIRGYTDDYEGDAVAWPGGANTVQSHNFHDSGDTDWTMVWTSTAATRNFSTEMVGSNSDTKVEIYKVTDIIINPNFPNQSRFIINSMQLVGSDDSVGNSSVLVNVQPNFLYVMKTESRTSSFGLNTDYNVRITTINHTPDQYDDITIRGFTDDSEGDAVAWPGGANTVQSHNFHDSGDTDWTMVWISTAATRNFSTEMVGSNSDTKVEIYKVTDIIINPNFPNQSRFIINSMQLVGSDDSVGNSSVLVNVQPNFLYVMKTESRTGSFGLNTDYNVRITTN